MNFTEARQQAEQARDAIPGAAQSALDAVGAAAVERLEVESPIDSGELARSWEWNGSQLVNTAPYASYALPEGLVPGVIADLDEQFETEFTRQVAAAAGW